MDSAVESLGVGESLVGEMIRFEIAPYNLMSLSSGAYLGSHSTVSQWARAASAARDVSLPKTIRHREFAMGVGEMSREAFTANGGVLEDRGFQTSRVRCEAIGVARNLGFLHLAPFRSRLRKYGTLNGCTRWE